MNRAQRHERPATGFISPPIKIETTEKENHLRLILQYPKILPKIQHPKETVEWWSEKGSPRDLDSFRPEIENPILQPILTRARSDSALLKFSEPLIQSPTPKPRQTYKSKLARLVNVKYQIGESCTMPTVSSPVQDKKYSPTLTWSSKSMRRRNIVVPEYIST
jgi:hypothetical protein